jgi:hypothetical protein
MNNSTSVDIQADGVQASGEAIERVANELGMATEEVARAFVQAQIIKGTVHAVALFVAVVVLPVLAYRTDRYIRRKDPEIVDGASDHIAVTLAVPVVGVIVISMLTIAAESIVLRILVPEYTAVMEALGAVLR